MKSIRGCHTAVGAAVLSLGMFLTAGCCTRIGDFSVVSTGAPQYKTMDNAPIKPGVQATSWRMWFLCFPLGGAPSIKESVDRCLDKGNGDFMERARIYSTDWSLIVFSYGSYKVLGEVGNSKFEQIQAQ